MYTTIMIVRRGQFFKAKVLDALDLCFELQWGVGLRKEVPIKFSL